MKRIIFFILGLLLLSIVISASGIGLWVRPNEPIMAHPGSSENKTWYIFLPYPGTLQLQIQFAPTEWYYLKLFSLDEIGTMNEIMSEFIYTNEQTASGTVVLDLDKIRLSAGNYAIQLTDANGLGRYNKGYAYFLTPFYQAETSGIYEKESNDKAKLAMSIQPNQMIIGNLSNSTDQDYYRIQLPTPGALQVQFQFNPEGSYYVDLYSVNLNGELNEISGNYFGFSGETVSDTITKFSDEILVGSGVYFLHIEAAKGLGLPADYTNEDYCATILFH